MRPSYIFFEVVRLLFCVAVGFSLPHNYLWLKAILIQWVSEAFDYRPTLWWEGRRFHKPTYNIVDKITDQIINLGFLTYLTYSFYREGTTIATDNDFMEAFLWVMWVALIFRIIGTILFLRFQDKKWLLYFPNYITELIIFYCIFVNFRVPVPIIFLLLTFYMIIKIVWEYNMPL